MNYEKYYKITSDGTYTVHFPNKKKLNIEEIRRLFSAYGNVLSIYIAKDISGLVFVKYKTLQEISCCLEGLKNSDTIRILPQKNKINNTNKNMDQNQYHTMKHEKLSTLGEKSMCRKKNSDWNDKLDNTDNFSDYSFQSLKHSYRYNQDEMNAHEMQHERLKLLMSQCDSRASFSDSKIKQYDSKHYFSENLHTYKDMKNDMSDEVPALICNSEVKSKQSKDMSHNLPSTKTKNICSKVIVIPMQEVIVANIHMDYNMHYILHLFETYNPIAATLVKTIPESNLRYCQVYFRTLKDALDTEKEFDNFALSDKNLIVLRKSRLIEEANYK